MLMVFVSIVLLLILTFTITFKHFQLQIKHRFKIENSIWLSYTFEDTFQKIQILIFWIL